MAEIAVDRYLITPNIRINTNIIATTRKSTNILIYRVDEDSHKHDRNQNKEDIQIYRYT
jgi:hypothetical protein